MTENDSREELAATSKSDSKSIESPSVVSHPPSLAEGYSRAKLFRDRAFWGMTITQYLGAFNDNVFKQLVLLICVDYVALRNLSSDPYQPVATFLFALPFVLFSGISGFLSDRMRKRKIVVLSKVAEIVVMAAGMVVLLSFPMGSSALIIMLIVVLFFMGMQSAFFGPSKYGILPELLREQDLPAANGFIQMTTFVAIILGIALSGLLKDSVGGALWLISAVCILIAIAGTLTSLMIRNTPIANPGLKFGPSCLTIEKTAWQLIRTDGLLFWVLIVYAIFWFVGAIVLPTVNIVGKNQLQVGDTVTSVLSAGLAVGIAIGCPISAAFSKHAVNFKLVTIGAMGVGITLTLAAIIPELKLDGTVGAWLLGIDLVVAGVFSGLFAVPLQVFLQARPPRELKGRIIGAMNFITWIFILASAVFYFICSQLLPLIGLEISWTFAILGLIMIVVALTFRPQVK